jgi:hypothetical protein
MKNLIKNHGKITLSIILLLATVAAFVGDVQAVNEVIGVYDTGQYMYYRITRLADNYLYNHATSAYATTVTWANAVCPMTEKSGTGYYYDNFPTSVVGRYLCVGYTGTSGAEAVTDTCLGSFVIDWTGSQEITASLLYASTNTNVIGTISAHNTGSAVYTVSSAQYNTLLDYANCIVMIIDSNGKKGIARILTRSGTTITLNRDIGGTVGSTIIIFGYVPTGSLSTGEIG